MSATAGPQSRNGPQKPKFTRASVSKVRTGCVTCKLRHLKCDEEKPACRRCRHDHRICDGYNFPNQPPRPCHQDDLRLNKPAYNTLKASIQALSVSAGITGSDIEKFLFHHAKEHTIKAMGSSTSVARFWRNYVLPLGHSVGAIKHALMALGAAHRSFLWNYSPDFNPSDDRSYESIAIQQYNRAIQHVSVVMSDPSPMNIQITLVCCLIFICFENMRGQYAEALRHLRAGSRLLSFRRPPTTVIYDSATERVTSPQEVKWDGGDFDQLCDIADMFSRLGLDAHIFVDDEVISMSEISFYTQPTHTSDTSRPFTSIEAAQEQLHRIDRDFDAIMECPNPSLSNECYDSSSTMLWEVPDSPEALAQMEEYDLAYQILRDRFDVWAIHFDLFIQDFLKGTPSKQELDEAMVLSLHQKVWSAIFKQGPYFNYKLERTDLEEIIEQAELIALSAPPLAQPTFTFDANLVPPLAYVFSFFEHADLQQRAISLLRSMNRREGIWDSVELAKIFETTFAAKEFIPDAEEWVEGPVLRLVGMLSSAGLLEPRNIGVITLLGKSRGC
ncbi:hypothetical protein B0O99DRAFT_643560 [Bisporella sp. PMI_857]|nr:hypothetical protein B0O99DRAFT_643560 [Bisporella sp. PMI_857]